MTTSLIVPVLDHPLSEDDDLNIFPDTALSHSPCPTAGHQRKDISTSLSALHYKDVVDSNGVTSYFPLR